MVPVVSSSRTRMLVMRKPEMTKKTSTPRKPFFSGAPAW
jgi:hypothetical protein